MDFKNELIKTANLMVAEGKGILAADESTPTCDNRFNSIGITTSINKRNEYRDMLFTTENLKDFVSGIILFDETIQQSTIIDRIPFPTYLKSKGIIPGIKVDMGTKLLAFSKSELITEGLDGLRERLQKYYNMGARFAKWRAVLKIGNGIPTESCYQANAHSLARYASLCQESGLVPIVEPEVLMDGTHTIEECYDVTVHIQNEVFKQLAIYNVILEAIILKPNMVTPGDKCSIRANIEKVADFTVKCLKETVPANVPGIAFLSGGQTDNDSTRHLNMMNFKYASNLDWRLTFSYGRALQQSSLKEWSGKSINKNSAQKILLERAKLNSLASLGKCLEKIEEK